MKGCIVAAAEGDAAAAAAARELGALRPALSSEVRVAAPGAAGMLH